MTVRGRVILVFRLLLLLAVILLAAWFALGWTAQDEEDTAAALFLKTDPVPQTETEPSAPPADMLVFDGAVELVGPDGSVLRSQTGARLEPGSGSFEMLGASELSSHRE